MPNYCYKCPNCRRRDELIGVPPRTELMCTCGTMMVRDFKAENATSNFHVSRDLYAEKKKQDAKKSPHAGDYYRSRGYK